MRMLRRFILLLVIVESALNVSWVVGAQNATPLAPLGKPTETYNAPFPLTITLDGELDDWEGVPFNRLRRPLGTVGIRFAAAADAEMLYLVADVMDDSIIAGQHGTDYWNEDSVEFYLNGSGDLTLTRYVDGVAQITLPAINIGVDAADMVIAGVQGETVGATAVMVASDDGYIVEVAVPLVNDVWNILPEHGTRIGFNVHLNSASEADRDVKLIWSKKDVSDSSYQNPGVFGQLVFWEIGTETEVVEIEPTPAYEPLDTSIGWDTRTWELMWSDEFDGEAGTLPDSATWTMEIGGNGWGNQEHQYYTNRAENASLDGQGNLAIVAREENPGNYTCHYGLCRYTSARLISRDKVEFTYGRVEARIKVPFGQGIWPAFWMLGANFQSVGWPNSGEIDVMEHIGKEPRNVHGTIHGPGYSGGGGITGRIQLDEDVSDDFHVFAVDWDPGAIRWYVDGQLYHAVSASDLDGRQWVFDHDFFLLLNVAVGGQWPGYPDETTQFPQTMLVDYVRVYKLAE